MSIEEQLKQEILSNYKSIRAFTIELDIPYSTLDSAFKRGIANSSVSTMIQVFCALDLDIESIPTGILRHKKSPNMTEAVSGDEITMQIMACIREMSPEQKHAVLASFRALLGQSQGP